MAKVNKKPKCLTCKHPLEEHTEEYCLHWNWDVQSLCHCKDGSDGVPLNKAYEKTRVVNVLMMGNNFIWFVAPDGKNWRWMCKEKQLFPIDMV
jgi:hypothetical protein